MERENAVRKIERLFPFGIEINTHEKLIAAFIDGQLENARVCVLLNECGYECDEISYGDLLQVFQATSTYTVSSQCETEPDRKISECEYFSILAQALNEL